jgi:hypothetical protein
MTDLPTLLVEVTFLRFEEGGRQHSPGPPWVSPRYMPHLVVQSPDIRQAVLQGNTLTDDYYLGVYFWDGPDEYEAGEAGLYLLRGMYPRVNYDALQVGATFTIREGASIVGFGTVLAREDPLSQTRNDTSTEKEEI